MRPVALAPLLLLLAGCVAPVNAPGSAGEAGARAAFLAPDMTLANASAPTETAVRVGSFFTSWADGVDYPTWRAPAARVGLVVDDITAHVRLRVTAPVAKTFRFPDVLVYGGSGDAWMALGNASTPPVLAPGQDYAFDIKLAAPAGGLWLPAGESFGLKVVVVMHQNDAADVQVMLGGPDPSGARWTERSGAATFPSDATEGKDAGDVAGSAYAGAATPESARHRTPVAMHSPARGLVAWMNTTDHDGVPDLDLSFAGRDGKDIAYAGTPTPREMLRLGPANLAATGPYALVVTSYGSAKASFTLEWRAG